MLAFITRRLVACAVSLFVISIVVFALTRLTPGNPVDLMISPSQASASTPAYLELMRHRLGLDRPEYVQYVIWIGNTLRGDLGISYVSGTSVSGVIATRFGPTLLLMGTGLIIGILLACGFGLVSAMRAGTWADHVITFATLTLVSIPSFFVSILLIEVFAVNLGWLPTAGMSGSGAAGLADQIRHLILPAVTLGLATAAWLARYVRASLVSELSSDYLLTALAKGASPARALLRHAVRNALGPVITVIALAVPSLIAGSAFVETIFAWPGLGQLAVSSATSEDYPVIIALVLMVAVAVMTSNLAGEVAQAIADPRIGASRAR